jgi:signal transduction histidine kinase
MAAFMAIPFTSLMQPSCGGHAFASSAGGAIRVILEDDSPVVRAADAGSRGAEYVVPVERYIEAANRFIEWARRNFGNLAITVVSVGTMIELAVTSVPYSKACIPFALVAGPALFFRRRFPLGAPTATFAALIGFATFSNQAGNDLSFPFFCAIAAMVTFGATRERRIAYAGLPIAFATIGYVTHHFHQGVGSVPWIVGFFTAAWLAGFFLSQRSQQTEELRERAERLELERELNARAAVAEERARIARELHDIVGHSVSVMTVQASAVRRLLRDDQEREREALQTVEDTGRAALAEMRRLVGVLRRPEESPALVPQPSLEYVDKLVEQTREAGLETSLKLEGRPTKLPQGIDLTAYRFVQEGLTNAIKHANAKHAEVVVRYDNGTVELVVRDDGTGDGDGGGSGHGLVGIRERVAVYGGDLSAGPRAEGGYELRATLPVTAE